MVHNVALVLGGGGAAGQAWQIGVIAGLAEAGLDLTAAADLVIGTSSGSTTAAQVRSGMPAAELLASVLSTPAQPTRQNREQPPSLPMATVFERMRAIGAAATSAADLRRAMGAFGLESDAVLEPGAGQRRAMVAARLPRAEWPDRPMIVVAVNAHTGELAASWCSRRSADGTGHRRNGARTRQASSRACAGFLAQTWQARSRPCASRAATSR
jgi:NTE family protein